MTRRMVRCLGILLLLLSGAHFLTGSETKVMSKKIPTQSWVKEILSNLSIEEKVGQMIMPAFRGVYLNASSSEFLELKRQIKEHHLGGLILFAGDVYESAVLISKLQYFS